jgi:microcystin-dependent protein
MAQPYIGEIRMFAGNFAPLGWFFCSGQLLPISEYETLFNLIGTTYGGDGMETFALPDLRGRRGIHQGNNYTIGEMGGVESVTLTSNQIPKHTHGLIVNTATAANIHTPGANTMLAVTRDPNADPMLAYINNAPNTTLPASTIANAGGSQAHDNMDPYLVVNYIISVFGVYPQFS